jgi:hypothetical protein
MDTAQAMLVTNASAETLAGSEPVQDRLHGAVLLLGSLLWEGDDLAQDGDKGRKRKEWRDGHLDMNGAMSVVGVPIRYGRRSESRNGQFTMVLMGPADGTAKVAPLSCSLPVQGKEIPEPTVVQVRSEVMALAKAEGIWREKNPYSWDKWGIVAMAVNPDSGFNDQLRAIWAAHFKPASAFNAAAFGQGIIDSNGLVTIGLPWGVAGLQGMDFCLVTPTAPQQPLPDPAAIAEAVRLGSYFQRTVDAGITTAADAEIQRLLRQPRSS